MSDFDASWLRRREVFDTASRSVELARRFAAAVRGKGTRPTRIIDLAAGTGASFRALAPLIAGDQEWLLVDHDPLLRAAQAVEIPRWAAELGHHCTTTETGLEIQTASARWRVRALTLDLARHLEEIDLTSCDGVTTTAFLDLVSEAWLDRLCDRLARAGTPLLAALTVDGRRDWQPPLPADLLVTETFRSHQAGDKGFGPASGALAASYLESGLAARGYKVATARSDWRIAAADGQADCHMLMHLLDETTAVARETQPAAAAVIAAWSAPRRAQLEEGLLSMTVGHVDLLALRALER